MRFQASLIACLLVFFAGEGLVLKAADTEVGTAQVVAFGGLVAGIGTKGTVGGGLGYAGTERLSVIGEFSYIPGGGAEIAGAGYAYKTSAKAYDFNGGVHYQFRLRGSKAVPYAAAGLGALHSSCSVTTVLAGIRSWIKASANDFYFNFGGGLRYPINARWGIRPELKIFAGETTFVRLTIGMFYQFGK